MPLEHGSGQLVTLENGSGQLVALEHGSEAEIEFGHWCLTKRLCCGQHVAQGSSAFYNLVNSLAHHQLQPLVRVIRFRCCGGCHLKAGDPSAS